MTNTFLLPRKLVIFAIILPIAALVGYLLASPDFSSFALVGLLAAVLCIPIFMRWHHALLIFSWNASILVFFLPGEPQLWTLLAGVSLGFSILDRLLVKKESQTYVPSVVWALIFLSLVVFITAELTGGIGLRVMGGSSYGGKRYVYFAAAVIGYFALSQQRIPASKVNLYVGLFFLSSITYAMGNLLYMLGPSYWFLYAVFPVGGIVGYQTDFLGTGLVRLTGLTFAGMGICQFLLCRFGIRGLMVIKKPWRLGMFLAAFFVMLLGGFRGGLMLLGILCVFQFFFEGLHRTRLAILALVAIAMGSALVLPFATKLPLSAQRSLAFLPINISPVAKADAFASSEWRLQMWKVLWPDVPKYLLLGKGSSVNPNDLYLVAEATRRGQAEQYESALVAGDYHSATLSLVIQFGIWGVAGFLWFCIASFGVMYKNYRYGPPELRLCNTFLLTYFIAQLVCFFITAGAFIEHFYFLAGIVGLSVSVNGSVRTESSDKAVRPMG
jgi:O-Antigen ligase